MNGNEMLRGSIIIAQTAFFSFKWLLGAVFFLSVSEESWAFDTAKINFP